MNIFVVVQPAPPAEARVHWLSRSTIGCWTDTPVPAVHTSTDTASVHNKYETTTCLSGEQCSHIHFYTLITLHKLSTNHQRLQAFSLCCYKHIWWNHLWIMSVFSLMYLTDEVRQLPAQHILMPLWQEVTLCRKCTYFVGCCVLAESFRVD